MFYVNNLTLFLSLSLSDWGTTSYGTGGKANVKRPVERGIKIKTQADRERELKEKEEAMSRGEDVGGEKEEGGESGDSGYYSPAGTSDSLILFSDLD